MSYRVKYTRQYHLDLDEIISYVEETYGNVTGAAKIYLQTQEATASLADLYHAHPYFDLEFIDVLNVRAFVVGKYRIFYRVAERLQQVRVLRIVHVSRDLRGLDKQSFE